MVLVTGGTGLVGSYLLLELCKQSRSVLATTTNLNQTTSTEDLFKRENCADLFKTIQWLEVNLLDITTIEPIFKQVIETVYHTAGFISFKEKDRKKLLETNIQITRNIVDYCIDFKVQKFIHFSSIAAINDVKQESIFSESSDWNTQLPHSSYAFSKKLSENEVWRGSQEGLNVIVFQPGVIIGSLNGSKESEKLFSITQKTNYAPTGGTGFVDVRDVVKIATSDFQASDFQQNYILVSENKPYAEVFNLLRKNIGLKPVKQLSNSVLKIGRFFSKFTYIFGWNFLSKSTYKTLTEQSEYSNEKITKTLNYHWIPIEESLHFHQKHFLECKNSTQT